MNRLHRLQWLALAYCFLGIAILVSLFWWEPSKPAALGLGVAYVTTGGAIGYKLLQLQKTL